MKTRSCRIQLQAVQEKDTVHVKRLAHEAKRDIKLKYRFRVDMPMREARRNLDLNPIAFVDSCECQQLRIRI